jgi:hypothetical protein
MAHFDFQNTAYLEEMTFFPYERNESFSTF